MCNAKTMRLNILIFTFLIFLFSNCVYSQKYLYQSICYIGGEVKEERVDTLVYKPGFDLEFIQKNLIHFQPSYLEFVELNKKSRKPIYKKLFEGNLIEFFDLKGRLVKYTYFESSGSSFEVEIKYLESGQPYKLIEYFVDEHHSENGIFSIQYNINYNFEQELTEIESLDGFGYECKIKRL